MAAREEQVRAEFVAQVGAEAAEQAPLEMAAEELGGVEEQLMLPGDPSDEQQRTDGDNEEGEREDQEQVRMIGVMRFECLG